MTNRHSEPFDDIEKPHPTVAEGACDGIPVRPLAVRLGDLWSDLMRVPEDSDLADPPRPASAVPLIDDMKGILQWD
jgi:hypothetical protein